MAHHFEQTLFDKTSPQGIHQYHISCAVFWYVQVAGVGAYVCTQLVE